MAQVFTMNITTLDFDSIPEKTMELVEATLNCLENGSLDFTIDETMIFIVNGRETWKVYHHNGRWQAIDFAYLRAEE